MPGAEHERGASGASVLEAVLAGTAIGFAFVDAALRFVLVNDAMAAQTGVPVGEHAGRRLDEVLPDRPDVEREVRAVLTSGRHRVDVAETAGNRHWRGSFFPVDGADGEIGVAMVIREVTEEERAREALARERAILAAVVAQVPMGVVVTWGAEHRYVLVNEGGRAMLPGSLDLVGQTLDEALADFPGVRTMAHEVYGAALERGERFTQSALGVPFDDEEAFEGQRYYDATIVPIMVDGRAEGVLSLYVEVTDQVRRRTELERELADEHATALALTRSLLPARLPHVEGLDMAARYQPASERYAVGGDLYDVVRWHEGSTLLVLADIEGKGLQAAGTLALVRHTLRTAALYERSAADILRRLNAVLEIEEAPSAPRCTVALAALAPVIDGRTAARVVLAGHPPPLLVRGDGPVETVGALGTMLGAIDTPRLDEVEVKLCAGDTLVLFSDGLIDAQAPTRFHTHERLAAMLSPQAGARPDRLLDHLHDAALATDAQPRDDLALLAVRVDPPAGGEGGPRPPSPPQDIASQ
ncbi:MAG TPA: SpoIIE family protein phosphatase [Solirubrobacteraceae bacterium]|nr:SpoIIE family protein phosphatase [Solirubrobacteraceae bacterium]